MYLATDRGLFTVAAANRSYFAGEYDWLGSKDGGATSDGDSLAECFSVIEESPVAVGDAFWSLFGHNVPDCTVSTGLPLPGHSQVNPIFRC